jgi:gamma-glutamyltranspeptidase/glutathione hydrolase
MGAVMVVVQPQYSHLGGDGFAMVWDQATRSVTALNSAGPAPMALDVEQYRRLGRIPLHGALAVTVPGVVAGWWALHQRHGKLPWKRLFDDAIEYADVQGFPASRGLRRAVSVLPEEARPFELHFFAREDETSTIPARGVEFLSVTLEDIARTGQDAFYWGRRRCLRPCSRRAARP